MLLLLTLYYCLFNFGVIADRFSKIMVPVYLAYEEIRWALNNFPSFDLYFS